MPENYTNASYLHPENYTRNPKKDLEKHMKDLENVSTSSKKRREDTLKMDNPMRS